MRKFTLLAAIAAVCATAAAATVPAEAGHRHYRSGWGHERTVVQHGTYPRYRHVYVSDPYAYRYEPRGYYPYYSSGYWKPAHVMRKRKRHKYAHPPYFRAWGYPDAGYYHRDWHARHHGRIHIGHW